MHLERIRHTTFRITLHAYELAPLISAARWIVDGKKGELPKEAVEHLRQILADYDKESKRISRQDV